MLRSWSVFGLSLITSFGFAQQPNIIPKPQKIEVLSGEFRLVGGLDSLLDFTSDPEKPFNNIGLIRFSPGIIIEYRFSMDEIL